ncbi:universal stress protein [Lentzea flaviverrucosa]|uniref:Nucleotide-binding universal stress protein, UspA family n=1 Tax=Lentzea flaviverrucosa TaxID=200379 RepID=A0A1H9XWC9_9PSEU|nr:universal stress protein [Lentzea flaviverrucosa]RDI34341.1 nucleotide-binding universal stress UspA family protein [Lentzea flaviverrucosa]SES50488.1 Nucleotide-binding universal stress protein, UspA family [Lentzea flaviverrucosa]
MSENESRPVVVGFDGSPASLAALKWAVEDARRRGCSVDVISAWHVDYGVMIGPVPAEILLALSPQAMKETAQKALDAAVQGIEGVEIRPILVEGDPRAALTKASEDAELLVVGSRGHSTVVEVVLGSVSSYCVHHASCPVVVIREPKVKKEHALLAAAAPLTPGPLL